MIKKIVKFLLILGLVSPVLFFLNTGFSDSSFWRMAQTTALSLIFSFIFVWPYTKKYISFATGLFIVIMSALFVAGRIESAELFGSSSFGLIMLILISYLPQLIKKGYVEKI